MSALPLIFTASCYYFSFFIGGLMPVGWFGDEVFAALFVFCIGTGSGAAFVPEALFELPVVVFGDDVSDAQPPKHITKDSKVSKTRVLRILFSPLR